MEFSFFSRNGELLPLAEATAPLSSIEYQYGFGVYENVRVLRGVPYFLDEHTTRLMDSARIIGLVHDFAPTAVARAVQELIAAHSAETYNLKILLIGGPEPTLFILPLNPHFPERSLYRDGAHTVTVQYERTFPHAKTLNMLGSYLAYEKAKNAGAYDALLIDKEGRITEGTRTNFFCIKGKMLYSPAADSILLGVVRKVVLKVAKENGFELVEQDITPSDLSHYDGAFLTSTSCGMLPIASVDEFRFGPQPQELKDLMSAFAVFLNECGGKLN